MRQLIQIGKKIYHKDIYRGKELMTIVGIRETQVELQGDYSGGIHNVCQTSWMPIDGVIDPDKKECPNKIEGGCPLPNIHCAYPDCERVKNPVNP